MKWKACPGIGCDKGPVVDHGLRRQPRRHWVPLGKQQRVPQMSNPSLSVRKRVDQLKLIVEHAATDQHMDVAVFGPLQQFHHQIWHILRQCAKVEDMPLLIFTTPTGPLRKTPDSSTGPRVIIP